MTSGTTLHLQGAVLTHVGMRRTRNEDCVAIAGADSEAGTNVPRLIVQPLDKTRVCLVADGMGGHPAGDIASRTATDHLLREISADTCDKAGLAGAIQRTHRSLFDLMAHAPRLHGMGTTVAGVVFHPEVILAFNVGDSRVYSIRSGKLNQLSVDHAIALDGNGAERRAPRVLSQCLGGFENGQALDPHVVKLPLEEGAEFLICSDGLHDMLTDADIERCLARDLMISVQTLFEHAMRAGGIDNISIIQVRVARSGKVGAPSDARPGGRL